MSGVDVLAVLDELVADMGEPLPGTTGHQIALTRAAVAELIQAAEYVESWITYYVPGDVCGREVELRELSAALGRVRGGAA